MRVSGSGRNPFGAILLQSEFGSHLATERFSIQSIVYERPPQGCLAPVQDLGEMPTPTTARWVPGSIIRDPPSRVPASPADGGYTRRCSAPGFGG